MRHSFTESRFDNNSPLFQGRFFERIASAGPFRIIELQSRRVIHVGVTRYPTDSWTAQQLREATIYGEGPKYLIHENDGKFGANFARVANTSRIEILESPYHAP